MFIQKNRLDPKEIHGGLSGWIGRLAASFSKVSPTDISCEGEAQVNPNIQSEYGLDKLRRRAMDELFYPL